MRMTERRKLKQSLYFPEEMLEEIEKEAKRQDRTRSWLVQRAWEIARNQILAIPSHRIPDKRTP